MSESTSSNDLPKSYYIGNEYVEDPDKVDALILFKFRFSVLFSNINYDHNEMHIRQINASEVVCTLEKNISKKLFNAIINPKDKQSSRADFFILGYIKRYMPSINEHIQRKKYLDGHILARTISLWDIYDVWVANKKGDERGSVELSPIGAFPPLVRSNELNIVFIRDLIDAMTDYLYYDLDECVRKIITSVENFFLHYELSPVSDNIWNRIISLLKGKRTKMHKIINEYVQEEHYPYIERDLKILRSNILFIYRLRNLLVHDKLRIKPCQISTCHKAIGTMSYFYQMDIISGEHRAYIHYLCMQFLIISKMHSMCDLDEITEFKKKTIKGTLINTPDDMNRFMFKGLHITKKEKKSFISKRSQQV